MFKKIFSVIIIFVVISAFAGCSLVNSNNPESKEDALKTLGLVYTAGSYTINNAYCSGYITSSQTNVCLYISVPQLFLEGQTVKVTNISNVALRSVTGKGVGEYQGDFTQNISGTAVNNGGAVLQVVLHSPEKWRDWENNIVSNNTPVSGYVDIIFSVS